MKWSRTQQIQVSIIATLIALAPAAKSFLPTPEIFRDYCNDNRQFRVNYDRISHGFSPNPENEDISARTSTAYYRDKPEFLEADGRVGSKAQAEIHRVTYDYLARFHDFTIIRDGIAGPGIPFRSNGQEEIFFPTQNLRIHFPGRGNHHLLTLESFSIDRTNPTRSVKFEQNLLLFPRKQLPALSVFRCNGIDDAARANLKRFLLPENQELADRFCADPVFRSTQGQYYITALTLSTGEVALMDAHSHLDPRAPFSGPELEIVGGVLHRVPIASLYPPVGASNWRYPHSLLEYRGEGLGIEFADTFERTGLKGVHHRDSITSNSLVNVSCGSMCECTRPGGCKQNEEKRFTCRMPYRAVATRFAENDSRSRSECVKITAGKPSPNEEQYSPATDEEISASVESHCGFRLRQ